MSKRFLTPVGLLSASSDPTSGSDGDMYFNASSAVIRLFYDSSWHSIHNVTASYGLNADHIDFSTTSLAAASVARLQWSGGEGTLAFGLGGGNINLNIGQEEVALCYNGTGSALSAGTVVYISGAQGQRPSISKASATGESESSKTLGIVAEQIANGAEGFICTSGIVRDIDTSMFSPGTPLWLSTTAGEITSTKTSAPNNLVFIGYSIKQSSTAGQIFVKIQNGFELDELHNVLITSPTASQFLVYNQSASYWQNSTVSSIASATISASSIISSSSNWSGLVGTASIGSQFTSGSLLTGGSNGLYIGIGDSTYAGAASGGSIQLATSAVGTTRPIRIYTPNSSGTSALRMFISDSTTSIFSTNLIVPDLSIRSSILTASTEVLGVNTTTGLTTASAILINGSTSVIGNIVASAGTHVFGPTSFYDAEGVNFTGTSASEGGQVNLLGGTSYPNKAMQLDNYKGDLRILYNNGGAVAMTVAQTTGNVTISGGLSVNNKTYPYAIEAGTVAISLTSASSGTAVVNFTSGKFTSAPVMHVTARSNAGQYVAYYTGTGFTSSSVTVGIRHLSNTNATTTVTVDWMAVQMT